MDIAAGYGIVILDQGTGDSRPPARLRHLVRRVSGYRGALAAFQRYRIVVAFDPRLDGNLMVPQVVFDAAAGGNVIIIPQHLGSRRLFRFLTVIARSGTEARRQIPQFLLDWGEWTEISNDSRQAIRNSHTYSHRMASIAAAADFSLIPAPGHPPGERSA
jgi:hypothetical protein